MMSLIIVRVYFEDIRALIDIIVKKNFTYFREELKTILRNCYSYFRGSEKDKLKNIKTDKITSLVNGILKNNSILFVIKREKENFGIDSYQKELLSLAVLCDRSTVNNDTSNREEKPWPMTKYITSQMLSSQNISHQQQVNLLLWLDKAMFGSSNSPPLSYCDTKHLKLSTAKEDLPGESTRRKSRKDFFLSLNFG